MGRDDNTIEQLHNEIRLLKKENIQKFNKFKEQQRAERIRFEQEVRRTTATAIASAFSFVIALFWRDAIQEMISKLLDHLGLTSSSYIAKIIAAVIVTIIGVIAIMRLSKGGQVDKGKLSV